MPAARKKLMLLTVVFWLMLAYIMAALVWWFISLDRQNHQMMELRLSEIMPGSADSLQKAKAIVGFRSRKEVQYIGEGATFMVIILVAAVFLYRATRRYLRLGQQQQNFMMAVTHELKTPIAIAKLNIETLQKRKLDEAQTARLLDLTLGETERLNDLCENILLASRYESGTVSRLHEPVNLSAMMQETAKHFSVRFSSRQLFTEIAPDLLVQGNPLLLKMLVNNLLENAVKYAPKNQPITLRLYTQQHQVMLSVEDLGTGIAEEEKKNVFEKFYRLGDEKTRKAKGTGLGLFLVKRIAEEHGGQAFVKDNLPQGSIFTVSIPAANL